MVSFTEIGGDLKKRSGYLFQTNFFFQIEMVS